MPSPRLPATVALLLIAMGCRERPWHGVVVDPPAAAPPLAVTARDGAVTTLAAAKGDVVLLYFGYTHCPDACPTTMGDWARSKKALAGDTTGVRYLFVAVDPQRDTPDIAAAYAKQFDAAFTGVAATDAQLATLLRDWGIAVYPEGDTRGNDYPVAHPARTYVVDREGRLRLMFPPGTRGDEIAEDIRRLR